MLIVFLVAFSHSLSLKHWNPGYKLEPWLAGKIYIYMYLYLHKKNTSHNTYDDIPTPLRVRYVLPFLPDDRSSGDLWPDARGWATLKVDQKTRKTRTFRVVVQTLSSYCFVGFIWIETHVPQPVLLRVDQVAPSQSRSSPGWRSKRASNTSRPGPRTCHASLAPHLGRAVAGKAIAQAAVAQVVVQRA